MRTCDNDHFHQTLDATTTTTSPPYRPADLVLVLCRLFPGEGVYKLNRAIPNTDEVGGVGRQVLINSLITKLFINSQIYCYFSQSLQAGS